VKVVLKQLKEDEKDNYLRLLTFTDSFVGAKSEKNAKKGLKLLIFVHF